MASPRVVRIPSARVRTVPRGRTGEAVGPRTGTSDPLLERRPNRAGTQRAFRLALVYLSALAGLYLLLLAFDLSTPGGRSPGSAGGLALFSLIAAALALGGTLFSLTAAPRAVEVRRGSIVVVGRWKRRRTWTPRSAISVRVLRHYPEGPLSRAAVDSVEVGVPGRPPRTYLVESGIFPPTGG